MITKTIELLGHTATDKITGFTGVIESVCFDLYGCVQAAMKPPMNDKGEMAEGRWFDVQRLDIKKGGPVMQRPDFGMDRQPPAVPSTYDRGPADKPRANSLPPR